MKDINSEHVAPTWNLYLNTEAGIPCIALCPIDPANRFLYPPAEGGKTGVDGFA
jgi:hypothetical protein